MISFLELALRAAGIGLITLSWAHIPIGRHLQWREEAVRLSPMNASVFHVHTLFICVVLMVMGVPALLDPGIYLQPTRAGLWLTWSYAAFWALRLYVQWFVYSADLWRGKRMETGWHWFFTVVWLALVALFSLCGAVQCGWLR